MKELSIEEKAKAYDEAIEYAHYLINEQCKEGTDGSFHLADLQKMFPTIIDNKDDRIIESLRKCFEWLRDDARWNDVYGSSFEEVFSWIEEQVKHNYFRNKIRIGDKVTRNEDGVLVNLSRLKEVAKKQSKQNPTETEKGTNGNEREIPNSSWSEEDEKMIKCCENAIIFELTDNAKDDELKTDPRIKWLRNIKYRIV